MFAKFLRPLDCESKNCWPGSNQIHQNARKGSRGHSAVERSVMKKVKKLWKCNGWFFVETVWNGQTTELIRCKSWKNWKVIQISFACLDLKLTHLGFSIGLHQIQTKPKAWSVLKWRGHCRLRYQAAGMLADVVASFKKAERNAAC